MNCILASVYGNFARLGSLFVEMGSFELDRTASVVLPRFSQSLELFFKSFGDFCTFAFFLQEKKINAKFFRDLRSYFCLVAL